MKKSLFFLFALICSMSLFTACSDDDDPDYSKVIEEEIAGELQLLPIFRRILLSPKLVIPL